VSGTSLRESGDASRPAECVRASDMRREQSLPMRPGNGWGGRQGVGAKGPGEARRRRGGGLSVRAAPFSQSHLPRLHLPCPEHSFGQSECSHARPR
jgi:hypothetical protein